MRIFNSYASFDAATESDVERSAVAVAACRLGASAIKFNVGNDPARRDAYRAAIDAFSVGARLLCECHPGTLLETPEAAAEFVALWPDAPFDVIIHPFLLGPEQITRWMSLFGRRVRHAHVQMRARGDERRFIALADDAGRARECLVVLAEGGFRGAFSLEFAKPTGRADDEPEALFAAACRDLDFLRAHWRSI